MLVEGYELEIITPPCSPGAERFSAFAHLDADISAVLPLLNAILPGAAYNPSASALTWKQGTHTIVFHPRQVAVGSVEDRCEAQQIVADLIATINRAWEQRDEITPDHRAHQRPTPMAVYALLPGTNCRACGQPTCFTFALKLVAGQASLAECPLLLEPAHGGQRAQLEAMLSNISPSR